MPTLYDNFERVRQYIDQHSGSADLSSYVSYAYLASKNYITMADVSACGYLTSVPAEYITDSELSDMSYVSQSSLSSMGYLTSVPSEYITQDELSANGYISSIPAEYITESELSGMSYATQSYVSDAISQIPGVDLSAYVSKVELSACGYLTSVPSEYITQDELSANGYISSIPAEYATKSYVAEYVATYAPEPDLSAYVSKVELSACGYLTSVPSEYITQDELSANGYISSIPSEYITDSELSGMSYITMGDVSACGYLTSVPSEYITDSELSGMSYATTSQLPVIDENLIPKTNKTYSLGSDNNRYLNTYTRYLYSDNAIYGNDIYGMWIGCEEGAGLTISGSGGLGIESDDNIGLYPAGDVYSMGNILPEENNTYSLGSNNLKWATTYSNTTYTTYAYLNSEVLDGKLVSTYYTALTGEGGIVSYSSVLVGDDNRNSVTMLATRRLCGDTTSYAAAFFTNSDGRSKFTHKTKTGPTSLGGNDDAFMCFNAYGFKLAYSGEQGVAASTEYDVLHTGNIGNLGYVTSSDLPVINESIIPKENNTYTLGNSTYSFAATYTNSIYLHEKNGWENINNWQTRFKLDGSTKFYLTSNRFYPGTNESASLGLSSQRFLDTYTSNIYTENVTYTSGKTSLKMNDRNIDIYANNKKLVNISDYNGFIPIQTNVNLGSSANYWSTTYTSNLYISSATYLPKNTYWWNGSSYVWLGNL